MTSGSLTIVGTGITLIAHITTEAQAWIIRADKTFFLVMHPLAEQWLLEREGNQCRDHRFISHSIRAIVSPPA